MHPASDIEIKIATSQRIGALVIAKKPKAECSIRRGTNCNDIGVPGRSRNKRTMVRWQSGNFTFVLANTHANALILRNGDVAEGGGLLNRYTLQRRIEGSNPSVSAKGRVRIGSESAFATALRMLTIARALKAFS